MKNINAISEATLAHDGCPNCESKQEPLKTMTGIQHYRANCGECGETFYVVEDGLSELNILDDGTTSIHLTVASKGEFFCFEKQDVSTCGCFMCDKYDNKNILFRVLVGRISSWDSVIRIIEMFDGKASGQSSSNGFLVKIGACSEHETNLTVLQNLIRDGVITFDRIAISRLVEKA